MKDGNVDTGADKAEGNVNQATTGADSNREARAVEIDREVEAWFRDLTQSTPVLRETETFNTMRKAVTDLKKRIS